MMSCIRCDKYYIINSLFIKCEKFFIVHVDPIGKVNVIFVEAS